MSSGRSTVSIIITSYNHGSFLAEAIESALAQTCLPAEIIVVDDGSTDESVAVVGGFEGVKCLTVKRRGLAAARNRGFQASTGSHLIFLDADDRLVSAAIETGLAGLEEHPECGFASGHYALIDRQGARIPFQQPACGGAGDYESLLRRNHIGMHAAVMYRRAVIDYAGGFKVALRACEDYDLYLRIGRKFAFCCHHQLVAEYRQHGSNMSNDAALMLKTSLSVLRSQRPYVTGNACYEEAYGAGMRYWREYYGKRLTEQMARCVGKGEWRRVPALAIVLLLYYPARFVHLVKRAPLNLVRYSKALLRSSSCSNDAINESNEQRLREFL